MRNDRNHFSFIAICQVSGICEVDGFGDNTGEIEACVRNEQVSGGFQCIHTGYYADNRLELNSCKRQIKYNMYKYNAIVYRGLNRLYTGGLHLLRFR